MQQLSPCQRAAFLQDGYLLTAEGLSLGMVADLLEVLERAEKERRDAGQRASAASTE